LTTGLADSRGRAGRNGENAAERLYILAFCSRADLTHFVKNVNENIAKYLRPLRPLLLPLPDSHFGTDTDRKKHSFLTTENNEHVSTASRIGSAREFHLIKLRMWLQKTKQHLMPSIKRQRGKMTRASVKRYYNFQVKRFFGVPKWQSMLTDQLVGRVD